MSTPKKILFALLFTVILLFFGDWFLGRLITLRAAKDDSPKTGRRIHPAMYVMTEVRYHEDLFDETSPVHINDQGFRHPEHVAPEKTKPRIFVLGGSLALGIGAMSDQTYYLAYLKRAFPEVEFVCAASGGYVANQQWIHLGLNVLPLNPDGVIILDGLNDLNLPLVFGQPVGAPWHWNESKGFYEGTWRGFLSSKVKTKSQIYRLYSRFNYNSEEMRATFKEERFEEVAQGYLHATALTYESCRARNIPVWHVFQPQLAVDKPLSEMEKKFHLEGLAASMQDLYPQLRDRAAEKAKASDVPFLDATSLFLNTTNTIYVDYCHLNDEGQKVLGEAMVEFVRATPRIEALKPAIQ